MITTRIVRYLTVALVPLLFIPTEWSPAYGTNDALINIRIPFEATSRTGQRWDVTQGFRQGTHSDGDELYAFDIGKRGSDQAAGTKMLAPVDLEVLGPGWGWSYHCFNGKGERAGVGIFARMEGAPWGKQADATERYHVLKICHLSAAPPVGARYKQGEPLFADAEKKTPVTVYDDDTNSHIHINVFETGAVGGARTAVPLHSDYGYQFEGHDLEKDQSYTCIRTTDDAGQKTTGGLCDLEATLLPPPTKEPTPAPEVWDPPRYVTLVYPYWQVRMPGSNQDYGPRKLAFDGQRSHPTIDTSISGCAEARVWLVGRHYYETAHLSNYPPPPVELTMALPSWNPACASEKQDPTPTTEPTRASAPTDSPRPTLTASSSIQVSINPTSTSVGSTISIRAKASDPRFNTIRVRAPCGTPSVFELGAPEASFTWATAGCSPGTKVIAAEARAQDDPNWSRAITTSTTLTLMSAPSTATPTASSGRLTVRVEPSLLKIGETAKVTASADDAGYNTIRVQLPCGTPAAYELGAPQVSFDWSTEGCTSGSLVVSARARTGDDPNWSRAISSMTTVQFTTPPSTPTPRRSGVLILTTNPSSTAVGSNVHVTVKASDAGYNTIRVNLPCGTPRTYELGAPEVSFDWSTNGCSPGAPRIAVQARLADDPGWSQPIAAETSVTLAASAPTATPVSGQISLSLGATSIALGSSVSVTVKATNPAFNTIRVILPCGSPDVYELGAPEVSFTWITNGCVAGVHTVNALARTANDTSWSRPISASATINLVAGPTPTPTISTGILSLSANPTNAMVGTQVQVHAKASNSDFNTIRIILPCGSPDRYELGSPELTFNWSTNGCPAGTHTLTAQARTAGDHNWSRPITASRSVTLSAPAPTPTPTRPSGTLSLGFNPDATEVGSTISVTANASNSVFNTIRVVLPCGSPSVFELGAPEVNFDWSTTGCSGGAQTVTAQARTSTDPNWSQPIAASRTVTLSVQPPTPTPVPTGSLSLSFNPRETQVGSSITVTVEASNSAFNTIRVDLPCGLPDVYELGAPKFSFNWSTGGCSGGTHAVSAQARVADDHSWSHPISTSGMVTLGSMRSYTPQGSQSNVIGVSFDPSSARVGSSVTVRAKALDSSYNTIRVTTSCGSPDRYELGAPELSFTWSTGGCPSGSVTVWVEARQGSNPDWNQGIWNTGTFSLSP